MGSAPFEHKKYRKIALLNCVASREREATVKLATGVFTCVLCCTNIQTNVTGQSHSLYNTKMTPSFKNEILRIVWNPKLHYCDHESPSLLPDAVLTPAPYIRYVFNYLPRTSACFVCSVLPFEPSDQNPGRVYRSTHDLLLTFQVHYLMCNIL
jgi:hypothetical protein